MRNDLAVARRARDRELAIECLRLIEADEVSDDSQLPNRLYAAPAPCYLGFGIPSSSYAMGASRVRFDNGSERAGTGIFPCEPLDSFIERSKSNFAAARSTARRRRIESHQADGWHPTGWNESAAIPWWEDAEYLPYKDELA